ncbi:DNA-binding transcriptional regulator, MarR family [Micromonospora pattaloongensis]|uniref:DNA-binding transcriptional regulator, MarR family n=1 Tax=Micromonospora pattaloongensis TaxID=405436 RepID=A0A1H3Q9C9_9ACTN|nr:MarR family winged helix-turn-helix transcriptional regulator [Micromonospora pattaloongensis]SDZ09860.1 DNA-binding transcriptional regulator, MarR family [Micromonospora pattaloongensis]
MQPGIEPDNGLLSAVEQELTVLLRRARGAYHRAAKEFDPDMDPAAYGLLLRLDEVGSCRVTDLAAFFGIGKPTVSRQLQMLEQSGLVRRHADAEDARAVRFALTEAGAGRLAAVRRARRERLRAGLAVWPAEDIAELGRLLARFNATEF